MRRNDVQQMTKEELLIRQAIIAIEHMGADTLLTEAQMLLIKAKDKLADYIDKPQADAICCDEKRRALEYTQSPKTSDCRTEDVLRSGESRITATQSKPQDDAEGE